jgi:hypothetical protein
MIETLFINLHDLVPSAEECVSRLKADDFNICYSSESLGYAKSLKTLKYHTLLRVCRIQNYIGRLNFR